MAYYRKACNQFCVPLELGSLKLEDLERPAKKQRYGKNSHISLQGEEKVQSRNVTTADTLMDLIRQMFPPNLIQVFLFVCLCICVFVYLCICVFVYR